MEFVTCRIPFLTVFCSDNYAVKPIQLKASEVIYTTSRKHLNTVMDYVNARYLQSRLTFAFIRAEKSMPLCAYDNYGQ